MTVSIPPQAKATTKQSHKAHKADISSREAYLVLQHQLAGLAVFDYEPDVPHVFELHRLLQVVGAPTECPLKVVGQGALPLHMRSRRQEIDEYFKLFENLL